MGLFDSLSDSLSQGLENIDFTQVVTQQLNNVFQQQRAAVGPLIQVAPVTQPGQAPAAALRPNGEPVAAPRSPLALAGIGLPMLGAIAIGAFILFRKKGK